MFICTKNRTFLWLTVRYIVKCFTLPPIKKSNMFFGFYPYSTLKFKCKCELLPARVLFPRLLPLMTWFRKKNPLFERPPPFWQANILAGQIQLLFSYRHLKNKTTISSPRSTKIQSLYSPIPLYRLQTILDKSTWDKPRSPYQCWSFRTPWAAATLNRGVGSRQGDDDLPAACFA